MAAWVKLEWKNVDTLVARLEGLPAAITATLTPTVQALAERLAARIVSEKLSGQVLHRKTGTLAGSVHARPVSNEGSTIRGTVEGAGGPAWYGRLHETGTERGWEITAVKAKALQFQLSTKAKMMTYAHSVYHPALPARPWFNESLDEFRAEAEAEINRVLAEVLKGK
jgi:hypothetical protein